MLSYQSSVQLPSLFSVCISILSVKQKTSFRTRTNSFLFVITYAHISSWLSSILLFTTDQNLLKRTKKIFLGWHALEKKSNTFSSKLRLWSQNGWSGGGGGGKKCRNEAVCLKWFVWCSLQDYEVPLRRKQSHRDISVEALQKHKQGHERLLPNLPYLLSVPVTVRYKHILPQLVQYIVQINIITTTYKT